MGVCECVGNIQECDLTLKQSNIYSHQNDDHYALKDLSISPKARVTINSSKDYELAFLYAIYHLDFLPEHIKVFSKSINFIRSKEIQ